MYASPQQKSPAGRSNTGFPAEEIIEDLVRYFEKGHFEAIVEIEERGTPRRYIFAQVLKYLNLINFYFQKGLFDVFPHKNLGDSPFKAITFVAIYFSIIEKRSITWIRNNILRRWEVVFNYEFMKKLRAQKLLSLPSILEKYPPLDRLSITHAHPLFLVEKLSALVPDAELEDLLRSHNSQRFLYFRIMGNAVDPTVVRSYFRQARVPIKKVKGVDFAFQFLRRNIKKVVRSPLYQKGDIALHDLASIQACSTLDPQPGERILDACAAPLMKTSLMQSLSRDQCDICAVDISQTRFAHSRLLTNKQAGVSLINADATDLPFRNQEMGGLFDKVLLDAPCTSSGAIYYSPETKWLQTSEYLRIHAVLQQKLILECLKYLKPGGTLVYAVCSYYREEGEEIIACTSNQAKIICARRLFPHIDKCQGFFVAKLLKENFMNV